MLPEAQCIHQTGFRFRAKFLAEKGNKAFFASIQQQLAQCPLIAATKVNPFTGSVLISHKGDMREIALYAEKNALFRLLPCKNSPIEIAHATKKTYKKVDEQLKRLSGGKLNLAHSAFLILIGAGIYQLSRQRAAPLPWHSAFWYALNIFLKVEETKSSKTAFGEGGK